jgi:cyanate lyase
MLMDRRQLTQKIITAKIARGLTWKEIAHRLNRAPAYVTAALLGQMALSAPEANQAAQILGLSSEEAQMLTQIPYRGALEQTPPTDPLIYRFYEIVQVFGTTLKALIEEEFGDGIMSAIDFEMNVERLPDPKGDRVKVTLNGKFLPYRKY